METYRRCNVIERILSMATSRSLPDYLSEKITLLCYRCTFVGGSTALITRCCILGWIQSSMELYSEIKAQQVLLRSLAMQVYRTCDKSRANEWIEKGGSSLRSAFASLGIPLSDD